MTCGDTFFREQQLIRVVQQFRKYYEWIFTVDLEFLTFSNVRIRQSHSKGDGIMWYMGPFDVEFHREFIDVLRIWWMHRVEHRCCHECHIPFGLLLDHCLINLENLHKLFAYIRGIGWLGSHQTLAAWKLGTQRYVNTNPRCKPHGHNGLKRSKSFVDESENYLGNPSKQVPKKPDRRAGGQQKRWRPSSASGRAKLLRCTGKTTSQHLI